MPDLQEVFVLFHENYFFAKPACRWTVYPTPVSVTENRKASAPSHWGGGAAYRCIVYPTPLNVAENKKASTPPTGEGGRLLQVQTV